MALTVRMDARQYVGTCGLELDVNCFLEWLDEWYLGIDEIDHQHLQLVSLLNQMADRLSPMDKSHVSRTLTMTLMHQLLDETRQHFRDEESIMREHDYPALIGHHRDHAMLLAELQDFIREIEEGGRKFDFDSLTALKHWLIDHVIDSDLTFARYLEQE